MCGMEKHDPHICVRTNISGGGGYITIAGYGNSQQRAEGREHGA